MNPKTTAASLLFAIACLYATAATAQTPPQDTSPPLAPLGATDPVSPPDVVQSTPVAAPPDGTGTVHVLRRGALIGAVISHWIREGDTKICKVSNGSLQSFTAAPGIHEYTVHSERKDTLRMEIDPGEHYYVVVTLITGALVAVPNLAPVGAAEFEKLAGKRKESLCAA